MTQELLIDMFYAAPELWYILVSVLLLLLFLVFYFALKNLKLIQKNYFINRDRERYAETLYASKDGYFAFIYPDEKINDPRKHIFERCSRRLAVMLALPNGTQSIFEDVLKSFYKDDVKKIQKYVSLLKEDGVSFEDEFIIKNADKYIRLLGSRINGIDGNVYCDMIWFKDVSAEILFIEKLEAEKQELSSQLLQLEDMMDNVSYPVWLRDEHLNIKMVNKKYLDFVAKSKEEVLTGNVEILSSSGESISKNAALVAVSTNKLKRQKVNINKDGKRLAFDVYESPFYFENNMNKIGTVGSLIDITELSDMKRDLKHHQTSHLEILGSLGTAFVVFDGSFNLSFYNKAFARLWGLEDVWLEGQPSYSMFLDVIRSNRMLPEVPDFAQYKNEELKDFSSVIEAKEDLLHLPNGKTFRRLRSPHPMGGLIFAFEDVSDRLATRRAYNELLIVRQEILNHLSEAVLIFEADGRLKFYNKSYITLWRNKDSFLKKEPGFLEIVETHKTFFDKIADWDGFKNDIFDHITSLSTKSFVLNRNDGVNIEVSSNILSDGSVMVTYKELGGLSGS